MSEELADRLNLRELLTLMVVDELDRGGEQRLNDMLKQSSADRDYYRRFQLVDALLQWEYAEPTATPVQPKSGWSRAWWLVREVATDYIALSLLVSGLFITAILLSLALWPLLELQPHHGQIPSAPQIAARITNTHQATWDGTSDANFKNIELFSGERLVLNSGLAEVTFDNGTVVVLEAPTEFIVETRGAGFLEHGKLSAKVPPPAVGFRIATKMATVVDLGTEFYIDATKEGKLDVGVLQGGVEVEMTEPKQTGGKRTLVAGEALRISDTGSVTERRVADASQAPKLPEAAAEPALRAVDHYRFEADGRDSAGPGFAHGEAVGDVKYVDGIEGKAAEFGRSSSGSVNRIDVPLIRSFNPGRESFSIAFWVRRSEPTRKGGYGVLDALAGISTGYHVVIFDGGTVRLRLDDDQQQHVLVDSVQQLKVGTFQHVAIAVDRKQQTVIFYIDGRAEPPIDISELTGGVSPGQGLQIGALNGAESLNGTLDELQFFSRILGPGEIAEFLRKEVDLNVQ